MPELIIVASTCGLLGALFGWLVGRSSGFVEGVEAEKQKQTERELRGRKKDAPQI